MAELTKFDEIVVDVITHLCDVLDSPEGMPPPGESPIETQFLYHASKYLHPRTKIRGQYPAVTICGLFKPHIVFEIDGVRIAVECDGRDFHVYERDRWRDAAILGEGDIDAIWRFTGSAITNHIEDCLYLMAKRDPVFFSERGRQNLSRLASAAAVASVMRFGGHDLSYAADESIDPRLTDEIYVRRSLDLPEMFRRWICLSAQGGGKLDRIIETAVAVDAFRFS
jgi:hypothetical protein